MTYNEMLGFDIDTNLELSDFSNDEVYDTHLQEMLEEGGEMTSLPEHWLRYPGIPHSWCNSLCTDFLEPSKFA